MSSAAERAARQVLLIAVILVGIGVVMIYSSSSALAGTRFEDSRFFLHGCGGDRDTGKRPMMGRVAEALADCIYLTSDNPRSESPRQIIDQIAAGMQSADRVVVEPDRRQAIHAALRAAAAGDVVVLAGKGDEPYQILDAGQVVSFADRDVARQALSD